MPAFRSRSGLLLAGLLMFRPPAPVNDVKSGFPLAYEEDFETHSPIGGFVFSDPGAWFLTGGVGGGKALEFAGRGDYEPKVRSPYIVGLIDGLEFGDFVLEADVMQTGREYGNRDMCVFFGFQDSTRFYYVHLASLADPNAHSIFLVRDAPRKSIAEETTDGVRWGDGQWHHIRIERVTGDGTIKVWFDDPDNPIMLAHDRTFTRGFIGIGSFEDSGKIDNIRIWSPDTKKSEARFFSKK